MYTVCPKCALTLVVTPADLRIAQGYVRCGRCLNVFNALARLSEDRPAASPAPASPACASPAPGWTREEPPPADGPIEVELDATSLPSEGAASRGESESDASPAAAAGPNDTADAEPAEAHTAADNARAQSGATEAEGAAGHAGTGEAEPATAVEDLETPGTAFAGPAAPQPELVAQQALAARPQSAAPADTTAAPLTHAVPEAADGEPTSAPSAADGVAASEPEFLVPARGSRAGVGWTLAAAALALILALQIVNRFRDRLATHPVLLGPLTKLYAQLGIALVPHWDVHSYDVRQLGATLTGSRPQEVLVRASVKNTARAPMPMPLLRVVLQDRFGNNIAARDVPPRAYLPAAVPGTGFIPAGGRIDATVALADPGPQATGFEIDACLARSGGTVACAHAP